MESSNDLLTIDEIAKELKVPRGWVYSRTRRGQTGIPHIKLGRHLRFKKAEVLKFFETQSQRSVV